MVWIERLAPYYVLAILIANILWYRIKVVNWSRGYGFSFWHLRDFHDFRQIISNESDPQLQRRYRLLLWATYVSIAIVVLMFVAGVLLLWLSH